ncbi:uncharacterized protein PpBr36_06462 [Pyricularia pennisetigena]|uniref:uncharacterized protein n=1 Tax=Pyricularia pennisetigena TaxID=1578925 RepID=UPI001154C681|nr:uncharacterized protein PpBr36_06462 [Pyricularia pennisetigena]TLS23212.1 hypothetical protein PpBr36_06462 [Pyricularia pennisetigena]
MAPKAAALEAALKNAVRTLYEEVGDQISVNAVRKQAEDEMGLDEGFFVSEDWKARSKTIIKEAMDTVLNEAEEDNEPKPSRTKPKAQTKRSKNTLKRESSEPEEPSANKRRKREAAPAATKKKTVKKDTSSSDLSELSELSDPDEPPAKKNRATKKAPTRKKATHPVDSDKGSDDSDGETSDVNMNDGSESEVEPKPKAKASKPKGKPTAASSKKKGKQPVASDNESADEKEERPDMGNKIEEDGAKEASPKAKPEQATSPKQSTDPKITTKQDDSEDSPLSDVVESPSGNEEEKKQAVEHDSDSSMSIVYDEPPKRKKGKSKGPAEPKAKKAAKASSNKKTAAADAASPDELEIKKLQGQLVKCGIRKIWAFELKQYGDDTKAKIKHLRGVLRDIGMDGRFSEAKAREIKEMRELAADLEAVQEMDKAWGVGGRASRSRAAASKTKKKLAEDSEDDDGDGEDRTGGKSDAGLDDNDDDEEDAAVSRTERGEQDTKKRIKGALSILLQRVCSNQSTVEVSHIAWQPGILSHLVAFILCAIKLKTATEPINNTAL